MTTGTDIYTTRGLEKIRNAAGTESSVRITHIALGDGLGAAYAPSPGQTALRRGRLRTAIERTYRTGINAWHVVASFPPDSPSIVVREMGFFDADGDLVALWAGRDVGDSRRTGAVEYLIDHAVTFDGIADGLVIVDAPRDAAIDNAALALRTDALLLDRQLGLIAEARRRDQVIAGTAARVDRLAAALETLSRHARELDSRALNAATLRLWTDARIIERQLAILRQLRDLRLAG